MTVDLTDPIFHDEAKAREWLEQSRWPNGVTCPHCGSVDGIYLMGGKRHRPGLYRCRPCDGQFTVQTGSVMESSHIALHKWALALQLLTSSKKGMSAHQLHRMIHVTYKSAWFMFHRIREGMTETRPAPVGGEGKIVEADEAYHGKRKQAPELTRGRIANPVKGGGNKKRPILALVERGGEARVKHVSHITGHNLRQFLAANADPKSRLMTDESRLYHGMEKQFASHETIHHAAKEYARGDVNTNSVEGLFGVFKRGMVGVYQHCGEQHFQRYLDEFTFRYNTRSKLGIEDAQRAVRAAKGMEGKRLTYRRIAGQGEGMEGAGYSA
jgi:transposase-like protein